MVKTLSFYVGFCVGLVLASTFLITGFVLSEASEQSLVRVIKIPEIVQVPVNPSFETCLNVFVKSKEQQERLLAIQSLGLLNVE